jgi:hypothetical protein
VSYCLRTAYTPLGDMWGGPLNCAHLQHILILRPWLSRTEQRTSNPQAVILIRSSR